MNAFDQALKEYFDNGGKVEVLPYRGPKESEVVLTKRKNVNRESAVETELDSIVEEIETIEGLEAH